MREIIDKLNYFPPNGIENISYCHRKFFQLCARDNLGMAYFPSYNSIKIDRQKYFSVQFTSEEALENLCSFFSEMIIMEE